MSRAVLKRDERRAVDCVARKDSRYISFVHTSSLGRSYAMGIKWFRRPFHFERAVLRCCSS